VKEPTGARRGKESFFTPEKISPVKGPTCWTGSGENCALECALRKKTKLRLDGGAPREGTWYGEKRGEGKKQIFRESISVSSNIKKKEALNIGTSFFPFGGKRKTSAKESLEQERTASFRRKKEAVLNTEGGHRVGKGGTPAEIDALASWSLF